MGKCWTGKEGFATAWRAWKACRQAKGRARLKVYRCRCGEFHVTHVMREPQTQAKRDMMMYGVVR
jgi:hypothetical protein